MFTRSSYSLCSNDVRKCDSCSVTFSLCSVIPECPPFLCFFMRTSPLMNVCGRRLSDCLSTLCPRICFWIHVVFNLRVYLLYRLLVKMSSRSDGQNGEHQMQEQNSSIHQSDSTVNWRQMIPRLFYRSFLQ